MVDLKFVPSAYSTFVDTPSIACKSVQEEGGFLSRFLFGFLPFPLKIKRFSLLGEFFSVSKPRAERLRVYKLKFFETKQTDF